jgi:flagellar basal-body rod protein FlgC
MDSMFKVLDISASGLTAERVRMDIIANNIANANTTLSVNGEPYKRKSVVLASKTDTSFSMDLQENIKNMGVEVVKIVDDAAPPKLKYDPSDPNADADGFIRLPNVNVLNEMVDMISATRSYEANATAIESTKSMVKSAFEIIK